MGQDVYVGKIRECCRLMAAKESMALSSLFDLTATRMVRFSVTITRNHHDAEDVVQSVLISAARMAQIIAQADNPWHYLLQMVRNESFVVLRKKKRWTLSQGLIDLLTSRGVDDLEKEEAQRAIWLALRTLPVEQSEVVVLKIWEDMTFQEIASLLGVSLSTVSSRYRYAIEKLSTKLKRIHEEVTYGAL